MVESGARGRQVQVMRVETLAGASQAAREGGVQLPGTVGVLLPLATSGDIREWSPLQPGQGPLLFHLPVRGEPQAVSPAGSAGPAGTFCQWPQSFSPRDLGLGSLGLCPTSVWAPFPFPRGQHQGGTGP